MMLIAIRIAIFRFDGKDFVDIKNEMSKWKAWDDIYKNLKNKLEFNFRCRKSTYTFVHMRLYRLTI